jgi:Cu-processing system ATP-binding protein
MLEIEKVSKRFGKLSVLSEVSMTARAGRVTAVLGPNAAGKTTLAKIVAGLAYADSGVVRIGGVPIDARGDYKRQIGYMPQTPALPDNLTPNDLFALLRSLRGNAERVDATLISELDLGEHLKKPFRTLSGGTRQKVNAVAAFLFSPSLVILDEPTNGLDPASAAIVRTKIRSCRESGRTVLLTSHIMSEIEQLADDVVLLYDGSVRFAGDVNALKQKTRQTSVEDAIAVLMRSTLAA